MKNLLIIILVVLGNTIDGKMYAQTNEDALGSWYMYFFNGNFGDSRWGFQGDVQYRNWNIIGDLEQLLLRGGITYSPEVASIKFTLGYGNITSGMYGPGNSTSAESRIYQEALYPVRLGQRWYLNHRLRFEQRFVENQEFRTRYRYNLFVDIPLSKAEMVEKALYLALYDEIFINGKRRIGNGNEVQLFDRNRFYVGLGYMISSTMKVQLGFMNQTTDLLSKNQLQLSLHHKL